MDYPIGEVELTEGDVLCLYTDGVTEAWSPGGEEFGIERLIETLKTSRQLDAAGVGKAMLDAVTAFSGGGRQSDDITLVVVKAGAVTRPES